MFNSSRIYSGDEKNTVQNDIIVPKHAAKYDAIQGQFRFDDIASLMKNIHSSGRCLKKKSHTESEEQVSKLVHTIAQTTVAESQPFTDGLRNCMSGTKTTIIHIGILRTRARRIKELKTTP